MSNVISAQMLALTQKNSVVREMFEEGKRLASIYGRDKVFDFSIGNPYFPAPKAFDEAVKNILDTEPSLLVHGYMSNAGYEDVRSAVAESLNKRFGTAFDQNNIIMTVGAAGGLNVILKTLLNPGDEVICLAPYFLEYGNYIANFGGVTVNVPVRMDDFQPDPEALKAAITPKTKAVIVNTPNNPTGVIYSDETLKKLASVLEEKQNELGQPIFMISDEPYRELAYDGTEVPWTTHYYKNTVVCYSWSKSLSLPGERIGYLVIPNEVQDHELVYTAASIATRVLGFVNAPSLMQRAVARCLDSRTDIDAYDNNRKLLYNGLKDLGYDCIYPQGAFYLWVRTPCDDKQFCEKAKKYNILPVPGSSFACPGYVRLAYCVNEDTIKNSMPAFKELAKEFR